MNTMFSKFFKCASGLEGLGIQVGRYAIVIVLVWIGGLKAFQYEAAGIVPFVANSPVMSFFYAYDAPEYKTKMNKEGELRPDNVEWHKKNNTYFFSYGLGALIVLIGLLIAVYPWLPGVSAIGSLMAFVMSLVTLSFLITTPETWVSDLGDSE
ncbi:MAG: YkgB family protein, partial [Bacteroidota bacterium]|nr:YkgB family protein [Bacteroidota bacterium]